MTTYGHHEVDKNGLSTGYSVDLETRKIRFQYDATKECSFDFGLLSEVGEKWQLTYKRMLQDDGIVLGIYDEKDDYCNVVMFGLDEVFAAR